MRAAQKQIAKAPAAPPRPASINNVKGGGETFCYLDKRVDYGPLQSAGGGEFLASLESEADSENFSELRDGGELR